MSDTPAGGSTVTITGTGFTGATAVYFGTIPAATYSVSSDTQIIANDPAGSVGTVDVTVVTPAGTSATSPADQFTYTTSSSTGNIEVTTTAPPSVGNIEISCTDAQGKALQYAEIWVDGRETGQMSDYDGSVSLTGIITGSHILKATLAGYADQQSTVNVLSGETETVNFVLVPVTTTPGISSTTASTVVSATIPETTEASLPSTVVVIAIVVAGLAVYTQRHK
jgi:hypothetical protein